MLYFMAFDITKTCSIAKTLTEKFYRTERNPAQTYGVAIAILSIMYFSTH